MVSRQQNVGLNTSNKNGLIAIASEGRFEDTVVPAEMQKSVVV